MKDSTVLYSIEFVFKKGEYAAYDLPDQFGVCPSKILAISTDVDNPTFLKANELINRVIVIGFLFSKDSNIISKDLPFLN